MNQSTIDAISIVERALDRVHSDTTGSFGDSIYARYVLTGVIHHLAYPDRTIWPKLRGQRKTSRRVACNDQR